MRGCAIVVASSCNSLQLQKIACGWWLGPEAGRSLGICSVFEFILTTQGPNTCLSANIGQSPCLLANLTTTKKERVCTVQDQEIQCGAGGGPATRMRFDD